MNRIEILLDNFGKYVKHKSYLTNKCEVWPSDAVQCINGVVNVAEPLPGLVRIKHLLLGRVTLKVEYTMYTNV